MKTENVLSKINELKLTKKKVYSNCYLSFNAMKDYDWNACCSEKTIVIQETEGGTRRLYFYTIDFDDFKSLIRINDIRGSVEILSKNRSELEKELKDADFVPLTHMKRVACKDITEGVDLNRDYVYMKAEEGFYIANLLDLGDIYDLLWKTFDTRISHLPNKRELEIMINQREFVIHRNEDNEIDSLLQYQATPRSYYVNQIVNYGDKQVFHDMVRYTMNEYIAQGGKYAYAWVEEKNIASLKFFEKFKIKADGVWNTVYIRV